MFDLYKCGACGAERRFPARGYSGPVLALNCPSCRAPMAYRPKKCIDVLRAGGGLWCVACGDRVVPERRPGKWAYECPHCAGRSFDTQRIPNIRTVPQDGPGE